MKIDIRPFFYLLVIVISAVINNSCDSNEPLPPKPPGYQEDIPWPSLADSPWPMAHSNPQNNGRSRFIGPQEGNITCLLNDYYTTTSAVISADGEVYIIDQRSNDYGLTLINSNCEILWKFSQFISSADVLPSPIVGSDNTLYFWGSPNKLYAVDLNGNLKWEFYNDSQVFIQCPSLGKKGDIYFIDSSNRLKAITSNGEFLWELYNSDFSKNNQTYLAFSPDGNTLYFNGTEKSLYAIDLTNKEIKWSFGNAMMYSGPMVDSFGNVYILTESDDYNSGQPSIFSLNDNGNLIWSYKLGRQLSSAYIGEGTIDYYGNVYYIYFDSLYSFNYKGNLNWKMQFYEHSYIPLICDKNNNIYLVTLIGNRFNEIKCISIKGEEKWSLPLPGNQIGGYSPSIGFDGVIILNSFESSNIFIIK